MHYFLSLKIILQFNHKGAPYSTGTLSMSRCKQRCILHDHYKENRNLVTETTNIASKRKYLANLKKEKLQLVRYDLDAYLSSF